MFLEAILVQFVGLSPNLWMKKSQKACRLGSGEWFCSCICDQFGKAGERRRKESHAPATEECNKYDLTTTPCF